MSYDKEELLKLSAIEKQGLAEALWNSIDDSSIPSSEEELSFVKQRLEEHNQNPDEGISWDDLKVKIKSRYGF